MSSETTHTRQDGEPDMRFKENREAAGEETSSTGQGRGGAGGESEDGVPLKKDGTEDKRYRSDHGFGSRDDASEQGQKGGSKSS